MLISIPGPTDLRLDSSMQHGIGQSTVTIKWTPPSSGGPVLVGINPAPLSGPVVLTTTSSHVLATVQHNTVYTVAAATSNVSGPQCPGYSNSVALLTFTIGWFKL